MNNISTVQYFNSMFPYTVLTKMKFLIWLNLSIYRPSSICKCFRMYYHVSESDVRIVREFFHQWVVVCGEEGPTTQALRQFPHHCTGNGRTIISSCSSTCQNSIQKLHSGVLKDWAVSTYQNSSPLMKGTNVSKYNIYVT